MRNEIKQDLTAAFYGRDDFEVLTLKDAGGLAGFRALLREYEQGGTDLSIEG